MSGASGKGYKISGVAKSRMVTGQRMRKSHV